MSTSTAQALQSVGTSLEILRLDNPSQHTSIFIHDPLEEKKLQGFITSVAKAHKEEVLAKIKVKELQKDSTWIIILTDRALYKCSPDLPLNQPRKRKLLTEYFDVGIDLSNPKQFTTLLWKDSVKTSMKASWQKVIGRAGASIDLQSLLQKREYICSSELQRDQFVWAFNRALQHRWQSFLEQKVIHSPEIYQQHHLVIKQNKRGQNQERLLIISTQFIYNVEITHSPTNPEVDIKWTVPIECIHALALEENSRLDFFFDKDELEHFAITTKRNGKKPRKDLLDKTKLNDTYQFSFFDERARASFVAVVRYLYENITKAQNKYSTDLKLLVNTQNFTAQTIRSSSLYDVDNAFAASPSGGVVGQPVQNQAIQRQGSMLEVLVAQHKIQQQQQEYTPILSEPLEKITHGNVEKAHIKHFALYPDLTIKWGDSATKFKYSAKIISVMKAQEIVDQLPPERRPNFFALRTTEKPLYLMATDASSAATWRASVDAYSGAALNAQETQGSSPTLLNQSSVLSPSGSSERIQVASANTQREFELLKMQLTVPVMCGYLTKFVKGGKGEHDRYFALLADGTINWGDSASKLKYSALVIDVDQDISNLSDLPQSQALRFIRLKTTDKTLELLCPTQESADRWCAVTNKVLNPDYEDDQDHDENY